jgi:hypothetical protein
MPSRLKTLEDVAGELVLTTATDPKRCFTPLGCCLIDDVVG